MALRLPRLPFSQRLIESDGTPTFTFSDWWQKVVAQVEASINSIIAAEASAAAASAAAGSAQGAADTAAEGIAEIELAVSYVRDCVLTAHDAGTDVTITISDHYRYYGDGSNVHVNDGTIPGQPYSTILYVYYSDPTRAGGAVFYQASPNYYDAAQIGSIHAIGIIETPAALAADTTGRVTLPPGVENSGAAPGAGTVTMVSVASANGLAGSVANPTTTPALTLSTSVTGIVKGNGTAFSAAAAATDYVAPSVYASTNGLTMNTGRLLGRTTASIGSAEEITVGTGLLLSGGNLSATGTGTVTTVSVASANGFAGTVATATTTPVITVSTSITGMIKGNGTAISAATAATDYVAPSAYASANGLTMATSKILGRSTASTGAAEEIAIGSGLSLSAGTLSASGSGGTLTTVSVVSANGFAGSVANPTTTPAITLTTSITGLLKGNSTAIGAAAAATDYVAPSAYASANGLTMSTARLLGRTTASTGAAEEITVSTGLSLSGGVLTATGTTGSVAIVQQKSFIGDSLVTPTFTLASAPTAGNLLFCIGSFWTSAMTVSSAWVTMLRVNGSLDGICAAVRVVQPGETTSLVSPFTDPSSYTLNVFEVSGALQMAPVFFSQFKEQTGTSYSLTGASGKDGSAVIGYFSSLSSNAATTALTGVTAGTFLTGTASNASPRATTPFSSTGLTAGTGVTAAATYAGSASRYGVLIVLQPA